MKHKSTTINNAKMLRQNMTPQEIKLWYILRNSSFYGFKFRRQVPIQNYVVDFICESKNLIIEIDGGQHNFDKNIEYDNLRNQYLKGLGYKIIRFWNNEIDENIAGVCEVIKQNLGI